MSLELSLSDQRVDLVTEGFDVALRIAALPDSSLRVRRLCAVRILLVGAPGYFARHGRPAHPRDLVGHTGLGYSQGASREMWRFQHAAHGDVSVAVPCPVRTNNADVLMPLLLAGAGLALQPEFLVWRALRDGTLETALAGVVAAGCGAASGNAAECAAAGTGERTYGFPGAEVPRGTLGEGSSSFLKKRTKTLLHGCRGGVGDSLAKVFASFFKKKRFALACLRRHFQACPFSTCRLPTRPRTLAASSTRAC